jgi:hypothetical protein
MMIQPGNGMLLTEGQRKDIFRLLVVAQDMEMSVAESHRMVAEHYGLNEHQIRQIEREGLRSHWPPL